MAQPKTNIVAAITGQRLVGVDCETKLKDGEIPITHFLPIVAWSIDEEEADLHERQGMPYMVAYPVTIELLASNCIYGIVNGDGSVVVPMSADYASVSDFQKAIAEEYQLSGT